MNRRAIIKAAYYAVLAVGEDASRRSVQAMCAKICGRSFQHSEVLSVLAEIHRGPLGDHLGTSPGPPTVLKLVPLGTTSGPARDPSRARHKVLELKGITQPTVESEAKRTKNPPPDPSLWTAPLIAETEAIRQIELVQLTVEQRLTLGRYHALKFGNCCVLESANRRKGAQVASQLASMAISDEFSDFSVNEYVKAARQFWAARGESPWFRPWEIKAICGPDVLNRRGARR